MTDEITQNDCQGEDEFMAYYSKLSALEAKLFKAIGIAFQLKDFGHNVIDEIDGECFEQDVKQMDRFTAANKAALAAAMGIVNPELERLKAELREAREIIGELMVGADIFYTELMAEMVSLFEALQATFPDNKVVSDHLARLRKASVIEEGSTVTRARAFLTKGEIDV